VVSARDEGGRAVFRHQHDLHACCKLHRHFCGSDGPSAAGEEEEGGRGNAVPIVFHSVLRPAWQSLCDGSPRVAQLLVCIVKNLLLTRGPGSLSRLQIWGQMIVPALATLLADATWNGLGDQTPPDTEEKQATDQRTLSAINIRFHAVGAIST
jgi:hypothetical protein